MNNSTINGPIPKWSLSPFEHSLNHSTTKQALIPARATWARAEARDFRGPEIKRDKPAPPPPQPLSIKQSKPQDEVV